MASEAQEEGWPLKRVQTLHPWKQEGRQRRGVQRSMSSVQKSERVSTYLPLITFKPAIKTVAVVREYFQGEGCRSFK